MSATGLAITRRHNLPIALKLACRVATPLIGVAYPRSYGLKNFLSLSDIALGLTTIAVITAQPLPASAPAVGVPPPDYLGLAMLAFPLLVHWPTHLILRNLFRRPSSPKPLARRVVS